MKTKKTTTTTSQQNKFITAATVVGADEEEGAFDAKLSRIAKGKVIVTFKPSLQTTITPKSYPSGSPSGKLRR